MIIAIQTGWKHVLLVLLVLTYISCADFGALDSGFSYTKGKAVEVPWTILIYMSADNDLEGYGIEDINELESIDLSDTKLNVLVLIDRTPGYDHSNGDWTGTRMYRITHDPNNLLHIVSERVAVPELELSLGYETELNMGDPSVLRGALSAANRMYPETNLALIMWGHGSGYRSSSVDRETPNAITKVVSYDFSNNYQGIYTSELSSVLQDYAVSVVGFDACNGGHLEIAYEIRNHADYFVASEDLISADGWEYNLFLSNFLSSSGTSRNMAEAAVRAFAQRYEHYSYAGLSAIDLQKLEPIMQHLNELSDAVSSMIIDQDIQALIREYLFFDVEEFINVPGNQNLDLGDMADFFHTRLAEAGIFPPSSVTNAALDLWQALSEAVIEEWHHPMGNSRATGIAVHYVRVDSVGELQNPIHEMAYTRGSNIFYPLQFVENSTWVPDLYRETGLLYHLWHREF